MYSKNIEYIYIFIYLYYNILMEPPTDICIRFFSRAEAPLPDCMITLLHCYTVTGV